MGVVLCIGVVVGVKCVTDGVVGVTPVGATRSVGAEEGVNVGIRVGSPPRAGAIGTAIGMDGATFGTIVIAG